MEGYLRQIFSVSTKTLVYLEILDDTSVLYFEATLNCKIACKKHKNSKIMALNKSQKEAFLFYNKS